MIYNNDDKKIKEELRHAARINGYSLTRIASELYLSPQALYNRFNRTDGITIKELARLCAAAGLCVEINIIPQENIKD